MKLTGAIFICLTLLIGMLWLGAAANGPTKECVKWETVYPTPTPRPMSHIYSEWIPMPGTSPGTGHGWISATTFLEAKRHWPPKELLTAHVLTDAEYAAIEVAHGMRQTMGSKLGYGFPPRQNFPYLYGGVILKNEWLPKRLQ